MGQALLLDSARVLPQRLERAGFRFRHPGLETALRAALARERTGSG
jgi:NAD dependent epimerase/dehydratase family enzyme